MFLATKIIAKNAKADIPPQRSYNLLYFTINAILANY